MSEVDGWNVCVIEGDMSSDSSADQYPQVNVCPSCIKENRGSEESDHIVSIEGPYDPNYGPECGLCGTSPEE